MSLNRKHLEFFARAYADANPFAWEEFKRAARGASYTPKELNAAWSWFFKGWKARLRGLEPA